MTLQVGLIGAGRMGRLRAELLAGRRLDAEVVAVCDEVAAAAHALAADLRIPHVAPSADALRAREDVDAVLVCTPTASHTDLACAAAEAGKAILCERPLADDVASIDRAVTAAAEAGVPLHVGFNRRFDPHHHPLAEAVETGDIGQVETVRITSRRPAPANPEQVDEAGTIFMGPLLDDLDIVRFLTGREIVEVFTLGASLVGPELVDGVVDTVVAAFRLEGGAMGTIEDCSRAAFGFDHRAEVFGSKGMVGNDSSPVALTRLTSAAGTLRPPGFTDVRMRYRESFLAELAAFVAAVGGGTTEPAGNRGDNAPATGRGTTPATGRDARAACVTALAAARSLDEARPVPVTPAPEAR